MCSSVWRRFSEVGTAWLSQTRPRRANECLTVFFRTAVSLCCIRRSDWAAVQFKSGQPWTNVPRPSAGQILIPSQIHRLMLTNSSDVLPKFYGAHCVLFSWCYSMLLFLAADPSYLNSPPPFPCLSLSARLSFAIFVPRFWLRGLELRGGAGNGIWCQRVRFHYPEIVEISNKNHRLRLYMLKHNSHISAKRVYTLVFRAIRKKANLSKL